MEQNINNYFAGGSVATGESLTALVSSKQSAPLAVWFEDGSQQGNDNLRSIGRLPPHGAQ